MDFRGPTADRMCQIYRRPLRPMVKCTDARYDPPTENRVDFRPFRRIPMRFSRLEHLVQAFSLLQAIADHLRDVSHAHWARDELMAIAAAEERTPAVIRNSGGLHI